MNKDRIVGAAKTVAGNIKQAVGKAVGDQPASLPDGAPPLRKIDPPAFPAQAGICGSHGHRPSLV